MLDCRVRRSCRNSQRRVSPKQVARSTGVFDHQEAGEQRQDGPFGVRAQGLLDDPYDTAFVTDAPYTFTRNPMYLGLMAVTLGFALFFGSLAMLTAPLIFYLAIDRMLIPEEEITMERLFGEQYLDYKRRVRRWL